MIYSYIQIIDSTTRGNETCINSDEVMTERSSPPLIPKENPKYSGFCYFG